MQNMRINRNPKTTIGDLHIDLTMTANEAEVQARGALFVKLSLLSCVFRLKIIICHRFLNPSPTTAVVPDPGHRPMMSHQIFLLHRRTRGALPSVVVDHHRPTLRHEVQIGPGASINLSGKTKSEMVRKSEKRTRNVRNVKIRSGRRTRIGKNEGAY